MHYIIETYHRPEIASARDAALLAEARAFGVRGGDGIKSSNLYFLEGELSEKDIDKLDAALFSEPVCEISGWRRLGDEGART